MSPYPLPPDFFASIDAGGPLEGVILLRRNGQSLGAWTKKAVPLDVVTVMAATMLGSLEALVETLGEPAPESLTLTTDRTRVYLQAVPPQAALVLLAPVTVTESQMRDMARRILTRLPPAQTTARPPGRIYNR